MISHRNRTHAPRVMPRLNRGRGSALIEYTIVVLLLVMVLLADPNAIPKLAHAVRDAYSHFVYALSISWI